MNLNFYNPQQSIDDLQKGLESQLKQLEGLRNQQKPLNNYGMPQTPINPMNQNTNNSTTNINQTPEDFYSNMKNLQNWNLFLDTVYGISDDQMFEDYKLFITALDEIEKDESREKLELMKNKLSKSKSKEEKVKKFKKGPVEDVERNNDNAPTVSNTDSTGKEFKLSAKGGVKNAQ